MSKQPIPPQPSSNQLDSKWSEPKKWWLDLLNNIAGIFVAVLLGIGASAFLYSTTLRNSVEESLLIRDTLTPVEYIEEAKAELVRISVKMKLYTSPYFFGVGNAEDRVKVKDYTGFKAEAEAVRMRLLMLIPMRAQELDNALDPLLCSFQVKPGQQTSDKNSSHMNGCDADETSLGKSAVLACGYGHEGHFPELNDGKLRAGIDATEKYSTGVFRQFVLALHGQYDQPIKQSNETEKDFQKRVDTIAAQRTAVGDELHASLVRELRCSLERLDAIAVEFSKIKSCCPGAKIDSK